MTFVKKYQVGYSRISPYSVCAWMYACECLRERQIDRKIEEERQVFVVSHRSCREKWAICHTCGLPYLVESVGGIKDTPHLFVLKMSSWRKYNIAVGCLDKYIIKIRLNIWII